MAQRTFLITYAYVPQMEERRQPHRPAHLEHARRAYEEGRLALAAATRDPVDAAVIVLAADDEAAVYAWIAADPYVRAGLVRSVSVRELSVVFGGPRPT
jgi:uncharacterized protein